MALRVVGSKGYMCLFCKCRVEEKLAVVIFIRLDIVRTSLKSPLRRRRIIMNLDLFQWFTVSFGNVHVRRCWQ